MKKMVTEAMARMFRSEKGLLCTSLIGFVLAIFCAVYVSFNGSIILPEGSVRDAFSFNAAIAIFILSLAVILPMANLSPVRRAKIRWGLVSTTLIGYAIETIQHFRGINPRFTQAGTMIDMIVGGVFGLISLLLMIFTVLLSVAFFKNNVSITKPMLYGIRYSFVSMFIAYAAGLWMIALQSRYIGSSGNLIIIHGLGFHALQALPLMGWLLSDRRIKRAGVLIHIGGCSWLVSMILISVVTMLGHRLLELAALPILAGGSLFIWLIMFLIAAYVRLKLYLEATNSAHGLKYSRVLQDK